MYCSSLGDEPCNSHVGAARPVPFFCKPYWSCHISLHISTGMSIGLYDCHAGTTHKIVDGQVSFLSAINLRSHCRKCAAHYSNDQSHKMDCRIALSRLKHRLSATYRLRIPALNEYKEAIDQARSVLQGLEAQGVLPTKLFRNHGPIFKCPFALTLSARKLLKFRFIHSESRPLLFTSLQAD